MQFCLGVLKLLPELFWQMSVPEFKAAMEGYMQSLGIDMSEARGISREEFIAMQQKFPD